MKTVITAILFFLLSVPSRGNGDTIRVSIKVEDSENPGIWVNFFAVNKRTGQGSFGDHWGKFDMKILRTDTIMVRAQGYETRIVCFRDSSGGYFREYTVKMQKEPYQLPVVEVVPVREFREIEKDIQRLEKVKSSDYADYNSMKSPITALYERFSKIGREKALVAELEYEDAKRALLKELLAKYVAGDIMVLSETEFDDFITFCNPDMEFIRNSSQYDLIMYFKARYEEYNKYVRHR